MPNKKRSYRRRKSRKRPPILQSIRLWTILLSLAALVIFTLVMLARQAEPPTVIPPQVVTPDPAPVEPVLPKPLISLAKTEVEAFLAMAIDPSLPVQRILDETPYRYRVESEFPSQSLVEGLESRLVAISGDYEVVLPGDRSLTIARAGRVEFVLSFEPPPPPEPAGPRVAIVMDDLGRGTYTAQVLLSIKEPVTFSILPGESHAVEVARMGFEADRAVMLHIPMEPQGYPAVRPGADALLVRYDDQEIRWRMEQFLAVVPNAIGANNHMGSRFTEDARALSPVMDVLKKHGMFFLDSLTTGKSLGEEVAGEKGLKTLRRDLFLDNVADTEKIALQIRRLGDRALRDGEAIGLCHPYPETLKALRRELPALTARGIQVVPVTAFLR